MASVEMAGFFVSQKIYKSLLALKKGEYTARIIILQTLHELCILTASVGVFFNLLLSTFIVDSHRLLLLLRNVHMHKNTCDAEFQCVMTQNYLHL